jgi:hypothetical protein
MDQSYLSFLNVVSQKMIPHFYVFGFGMEHWVLGNAYGTGAITLKWDMVLAQGPVLPFHNTILGRCIQTRKLVFKTQVMAKGFKMRVSEF